MLSPGTFDTMDDVPGDYPQGKQGEWDTVLLRSPCKKAFPYQPAHIVPLLVWVRLDFTNCLQFREYF